MKSKRLSVIAITVVGPFAAMSFFPTVTASAANPVTPGNSISAGADAAVPTVKIEGSPAIFSPTKIKVKGVTGPACTPQHYSFKVTNKTSVAQQLEYNGSPFSNPIPPGKHIPVCDEDGINFKLGLESNAAAVLKVKG